MEPQDNKRLALTKAISAHEQAGSSLTDLTNVFEERRYGAMLERIKMNVAELEAELGQVKGEEQA